MARTSPAVDRRQWIALIVLCFGQLMLVLDTTVVNVALPAIQRDLHFSGASLAWVINGYLITFAGFLLLAGRLGDLLGRKRMFISGLIMFTLASALCGLSPSAAILIVARLLQGVGAATTGAVIVAIIAASFSGQARAKAIGVFTFTAVAGGSIGLLAGGALTQTLGWHWIFFINVPIGIVVIPLSQLLIEPHKGIGLGNGIDWPGSLLITAALMTGTFAIVEASNHGWGSTTTLGGGAGALALVALFILRETSTPHPLVALRIFRSRNVSGANFARGLLALGMYGTMFLLSLYMQDELHYGPLRTGLAFLPMAVMNALSSIGIAARLAGLIGPKRTLLIGYALVIAALLAFAHLPTHSSYAANMLPGLLVIGAGMPLAFNPAIMLSVADVPPADLGVASGMSNVSHYFGGAIGLALVATLSDARARSLVASGNSPASAAVGGDHLAFTVAALTLLVGFVANALVLHTTQHHDVPTGDRVSDGTTSAAAEPLLDR